METGVKLLLAERECLQAMACLRDGDRQGLARSLDRLSLILDVRLARESREQERSVEKWYAFAGE